MAVAMSESVTMKIGRHAVAPDVVMMCHQHQKFRTERCKSCCVAAL